MCINGKDGEEEPHELPETVVYGSLGERRKKNKETKNNRPGYGDLGRLFLCVIFNAF